jgi:hypothetical protein
MDTILPEDVKLAILVVDVKTREVLSSPGTFSFAEAVEFLSGPQGVNQVAVLVCVDANRESLLSSTGGAN